jgi:hypothetical protein
MRTLILHIGTHRTATSSVQAFLHANGPALLRRGILYPFGVKRHVVQMNRLFAGQVPAPALAADLTRRADSRRQRVDTIILSDEDICTRRDLAPLAPLRETFDVKVVFALRRQDLWLESWYLQNVKWQWNPTLAHATFAEFLARREEFHWADYAAYVDHLEAVFGRGNLRLYVFEKAQMPAGPVAAFAAAAGIGDIADLAPAPHANPSHSALMSEFMRRLPLDEAPPTVRGMLERACSAVDAGLAKSPAEASPLLIDPETRAAILARHAAGNARLAERYFGRAALFLEPPPPADAPLARLALPDSPEALMERLVAPFVRELIAQTRDLTREAKA